MTIQLGTKISHCLFSYPMIGLNRHILYNSLSRTLMLTDNDSKIIKELGKHNLDYDTFVMVARCMFMERVDKSN